MIKRFLPLTLQPDLRRRRRQSPINYRLTIDTIEETWLKIIVDDQQAKQYRLNPGDHIELEGSRNFNLLIGNAGGIRLRLNGKAVALSGKSGQVVNIQLP